MNTTLYEAARAAFNAYAGMDAPQLPADELSALQVRLLRWEQYNFGCGPSSHHALGIAEEVGELLAARTYDDVRDAFGDVMVFTTQLCTDHRLDFGTLLVCAGAAKPTRHGVSIAVGRICHVVLKSEQGIRGLADHEKARRATCEAVSELLAELNTLISPGMYLPVVYRDVAEKVLLRDWQLDPEGRTAT